AKRLTPLATLEREASDQPPPRGFIRALEAARSDGRYGIIAEIKRASPSRGLIRADFDAHALAAGYASGGAACLSVLTDRSFFEGSRGDLVRARAAVPLPVLRKDFMIDPYQIVEARAMGADCVLLIMAALSDRDAGELEELAMRSGMDVLIEVHDRAELQRALRLESRLIGINNRDLKTLAIDLATTETLAAMLPPGRILVSESGIQTARDLARLARAGANSFLIGESLMKEPDVEAALRALLMP
ncbi:MAG TPA: indole-3-glycerol phosphate synthase TrpC, partial [Stellaceae bacterium]|nr:indole-3-glycerol phosphate synthase TrpC [Stellaceae bacterium]